jgi:hypothetical protein
MSIIPYPFFFFNFLLLFFYFFLPSFFLFFHIISFSFDFLFPTALSSRAGLPPYPSTFRKSHRSSSQPQEWLAGRPPPASRCCLFRLHHVPTSTEPRRRPGLVHPHRTPAFFVCLHRAASLLRPCHQPPPRRAKASSSALPASTALRPSLLRPLSTPPPCPASGYCCRPTSLRRGELPGR